MTAEQFRHQIPHRDPEEKLEGYYGSRVSVTEGTKPQDRSRLVQAKPKGLDTPTSGNVHRNTVREYKAHDVNHKPYTTAHRPAPSPSEPFDPSALKSHQERMITNKQKSKNRKAK